MTEKLYERESTLRDFQARVLSCRPNGERFEVVMDQTAFYPEGGGQPGDRGILGGAAVLDTQIRDGEIVHLTDQPLEESSQARGRVDGRRRLTLSQQHTGEHIVSGLVRRLHGFDNVGFRMGSEAVTMDFNGELPEEAITELELQANDAVWDDLPVEVRFPLREELEQLDYRSKIAITGQVRIVTIPGVDVCACCGTHVLRTSLVGGIKLLSSQRHKGGTRILMLAGIRAMEDYRRKDRVVRQVVDLLSAKPGEEFLAVRRLSEENASRREMLAEIQSRLFSLEAQGMEPTDKNRCLFREGFSPDALRRFALVVAERCAVAAVFSPKGREHWQYALASVRQEALLLGKELNQRFGGRGGGSAQLVQGSLTGSREEIELFFSKLTND